MIFWPQDEKQRSFPSATGTGTGTGTDTDTDTHTDPQSRLNNFAFFFSRTLRRLLCSVPLFVLAAGCAANRTADYTEYAVSVGQPYPAEAANAQARVNRFLARHRKTGAALPQYLAVESTELPANEVPGLVQRMGMANTTTLTTVNPSDVTNRAAVQVKFVMIFDAATGRPATDEGFVVMSTPTKGKMGMFGGFTAMYIGRG